MCGILGYIGERTDRSPDLDATLAQLKHRGPDAHGTWRSPDGRVWFGHARLSILDLSPSGAQPMVDELTGDVIIFNGEIYNHLQIRDELVALGVPFRGHSDTETLLRAYGAWGTSVFSRLRGMFAFAIYDSRSQSVVLCRDRFGIKPLYFAREGGHVAFSSEVRPLLSIVGRRISPAGLAAYLQRGSCVHEQLLFEDISEFPAGCYGNINPRTGRLAIDRFWPSAKIGMGAERDEGDEGEPVLEVRDLLENAVRSHLLADVPVACFLSGGLDSSVVAALAARELGSKKLTTFSVGFSEKGFDESEFARHMADLYGTDHHHIQLTDAQKLQFATAAVAAMDLPSVDAINTFIVSDYVARNGFKVVLSGLGADEVFGGYPVFRDFSMVRMIASLPAWLRDILRTTGRGNMLLDDFPEEKGGESLSCWWRRIWPGEALRRMGLPPPPFVPEPGPPLRDTMAELSWGEIAHYMRDTLLRDSDAMSMAHSVEIRVPYLDHPLVTKVLSFPAREKFSPRKPKDLLLRATADLIPEEIWNRPKMGFSLPMQAWMQGPLRDYCSDGLHVLVGEGILRGKEEAEIWRDFLVGKRRWAAVWALVVLGHYLRNTSHARSN